MTKDEAIQVLFYYGLPMLEENARDLAKDDDEYDGPISEHPDVVRCKQAIDVLRRAIRP